MGDDQFRYEVHTLAEIDDSRGRRVSAMSAERTKVTEAFLNAAGVLPVGGISTGPMYVSNKTSRVEMSLNWEDVQRRYPHDDTYNFRLRKETDRNYTQVDWNLDPNRKTWKPSIMLGRNPVLGVDLEASTRYCFQMQARSGGNCAAWSHAACNATMPFQFCTEGRTEGTNVPDLLCITQHTGHPKRGLKSQYNGFCGWTP